MYARTYVCMYACMHVHRCMFMYGCAPACPLLWSGLGLELACGMVQRFGLGLLPMVSPAPYRTAGVLSFGVWYPSPFRFPSLSVPHRAPSPCRYQCEGGAQRTAPNQIFIHIHIYICMKIYICIMIYVCLYIYTHTYIHTYLYVCMYVRMYVCMYMRTYVYIYI